MIFKRAALFLGLLAFSSPALADPGTPSPSRDFGVQSGSGAGSGEASGGQPEISVTDLAPRLKPRPISSDRLQVTTTATGRLVVKFEDDLRVRISPRGDATSLGAVSIDPVNQVLAQFDIQLSRAFSQSDEKIADILRRAEQHSGRRQPDLSGMMYVDVDRGNLLAAARALNDLPQVEWVEIEEHRFPGASPSSAFGGATGACCFPGNICESNMAPAMCAALGGLYQGDDSSCAFGGCAACCLPDGSCQVRVIASCNAVAGDWQGAGVPCSAGCGGCCLPGAAQQCQNTTQAVCTSFGGTFQGVGIICPPGGNPLCGACCLPSPDPDIPADCQVALELSCIVTLGGIYTSNGVLCIDVDCDDLTNTGCGAIENGNCFQPGGNGTPFCDDAVCCELVCECDPFCCDEDFGEWDAICVLTANLICAVDAGADRCATNFNDSCFEPHSGGGCNDFICCSAVCALQAACCEDDWDGLCVLLALDLCTGPIAADDPTPDLEPFQAYLTAAPLNPFAFPGENGVGLNLRTPAEPWEDLNGNGWWDPGEPFDDLNGNGVWDGPGGVEGLAEELLRVYGVDETGMGNLTRGKSIRVAVIEWAFYDGHEDLDVWVEPGQTLILIPEITEPDHGTASLGIIGAREDGIGMTGIAPEANLLFFPLTSIEEGPRENSAWLSAIDILRAGDVISCSYGPGPATGNLNNSLTNWTFIRLASDLGITTCIAAGNDCFNLDGAPDLGDSGGIVVGAVSPGTPYYRLAFSNYYTEPDPGFERSNVVHSNAWGKGVASTGYGDLSIAEGVPGTGFNRRRAYTASYGGTSAAAPQIAGVVAVLQGFAKQFYGIPLTPEILRSTISGDTAGPTIRGQAAGADCAGPLCTIDLDPDTEPARFGTYPNLAGDFGSATSAILNQTGLGFDDSPLIQDILILKGQWLAGNRFSVKGFDNNFLIVESRFVNRGKPGNNPGLEGDGPRVGLNLDDVPQARAVTYLGSGQVTDIIVIAKSDVPAPATLGVQVFYGNIDVFQIGFIEAFNWTTNRWEFLGLGLLNPGPGGALDGGALAAANFVRPDDSRILVRTWNLGFAIDSPLLGPGKFRTRIDLIGIDVETGGPSGPD